MRLTITLSVACIFLGCSSPELDGARARYNLGVALMYAEKTNSEQAKKHFDASRKYLEMASSKGFPADANRELATLRDMVADWDRLQKQNESGK